MYQTKRLMITWLIIFSVSNLNAADILHIAQFSQATSKDITPLNWEELTFNKIENHTIYRLVKDDDAMVIKATTNQSASGLIRKTQFDLKTYPIIEWRWKINNIYVKGNVRKKSGDDYPARIYITFQYNPKNSGFIEKMKFNAAKLLYGEYPPVASINYIWESKTPVGTIVPNPYINKVMMFVVDSGNEKLGQWVKHTRNVYDDYMEAFGTVPPLVSGVAIMSDSDNTKESAVAYYGDITFRKGTKHGLSR